YQKPIFIFQDQIELTIFTSLGGADDYDTCKKRAQKIKISDVEVSIINKEDLIKSKMFSNRPIDREDVKYLKKL
ncbi:MAG: hypothetical protein Q8Q33_10440, partial [Chlamydiota bacterium]|nr:hypothetical protein [Chlamydiota bacterium]